MQSGTQFHQCDCLTFFDYNYLRNLILTLLIVIAILLSRETEPMEKAVIYSASVTVKRVLISKFAATTNRLTI